MSDVVKRLTNFHDKKTTKDKRKSNYYFIAIFGYSLNKLQFYSPPFFFSCKLVYSVTLQVLFLQNMYSFFAHNSEVFVV